MRCRRVHVDREGLGHGERLQTLPLNSPFLFALLRRIPDFLTDDEPVAEFNRDAGVL
jgi:hypothetical protein